MLLSIVLMVKNEEKFLDETLNALGVLRESIDSELIILDTGSTDNTIKIAKKYTDKVYFEKWNNDFAEMRNKSISYARGEWLLILDADEVLIDSNKIIEFFNNKTYKNYNSASVIIKNIHSEDMKEYSKASNLRMFKREGFRYEGAIHEQPKYKNPIYNNIAEFNHFGYLYIDEDFRQRKLKRNEVILLKEFKKDPGHPYINFQLAKNYLGLGNREEALFYMEASLKQHEKESFIPPYLYSNLANIYRELNKYEETEKLCKEYIKNVDDKNIDIYYYLGAVQQRLYKYNDSIESFKRYLYLVENYDLSTQANNIFSDGMTVGNKETAHLGIIENYFNLNNFANVVKEIKKLTVDQLKNIYYISIISLVKENQMDYLIKLYNEKLNAEIEKSTFKTTLENVIFKLNEIEKQRLFKVLSKIEGNYGLLNKARLGFEFTLEDYNRILNEENYNYFSDLIYYGIDNGHSIENLLKGVSSINKEKYLQYLLTSRKDKVGEIYDYVMNYENTLDIDKLTLISTIAKNIIKVCTISKEKYKKLFKVYLAYEYICIKFRYKGLSDEEIMYYSKDSDEIFVINLHLINKNRNKDKIKYIREIKDLLLKYPNFKNGIEDIIKEFEKSISVLDEVTQMRQRFEEIIKSYLNEGEIEEAKKHIEIYKKTFEKDMNIVNLEAVLYMIKGDFYNADKLLKSIFILDVENFDIVFNIACVKEYLGNDKEVINFLNYILDYSNDEILIKDCENKILEINNK